MEQRTAEELSKPEYNYFIALNLSVTETNNAVITKAINKLLGNSGGDILTRRLLVLRDDINETLINNPQLRKQEAERAKEFKLDEIMLIVKSTCLSNGMIYKSELTDLCNAANKNAKFFEFADLEKKFLDFNKGGAVKYRDNTTNVIPFNQFDKVSTLLEAPPAKESLYEFLNVPGTASLAELEAALKQTYDEAQKKSDLKVKQAASNLCSEAREILIKDPKIRKQYDYYIKVKAKVWNQFRLRKKYGGNEMSISMYYDFAQILMKDLNLPIDEVEEMLGAGLKFYNIVISGGQIGTEAKSELGIKSLELCPYPDCGKVYESGLKVCPHCGKPLEVLCWNCNSKMPFTSKSKVCPTCGVSYLSRGQFMRLVSDADKVLSASDCDMNEAVNAVAALKNIVGNYKAVPTSLAAKKISEFEALIEKKSKLEATTGKQYNEAMTAVNDLMALKNYIQAKNAAEQIRRKFTTYRTADTAEKIADIDLAISNAQRTLQAAKACIARGDEVNAIEGALKALDICSDYNEARLFIANYPPKAPLSITATATEHGVKLNWRVQPGAKNMRYNIIRKVGNAPKNSEDGAVVASDLTIDFFEDKNLGAATPYYYGVFAERGGVKSKVVNCVSPVQIFFDVSNVRQEMVEEKILVKWDVPDNLKSIEVWKKKGVDAPLSPGDGTKLSNVGKTEFTDNDCTGENSYLIVCKYEINGKQFASRGISRTFRQFEIPKAPNNVVIKQLTDCEFSINAEAKGGTLKLLFSKEKLTCRTNTPLQTTEYNSIVSGTTELDINYSGSEMTFMIPRDSVGYIYPVIYNDQLFLVSMSTIVNSIVGLKNIAYNENDNSCILTGVLHPMVTSLTAKISEKKFVEDFSESADTITFSADEFRRTGGFKLTLKHNTNYYITVFAEVRLDGKSIMCKGEKLDAPICQPDEVTVKYNIVFTFVPLKPIKVTLKFVSDVEVSIPDMLLVKGFPKPADKSHGEFVEKIAGVTLKKGLFGKEYTYKTTLSIPAMAKNMRLALFPANEDTGYVVFKEVISL